MLRQLFLKPLSATAIRRDPQDGAGPSTPGFDFGAGCGDAGSKSACVNQPNQLAASTACNCSLRTDRCICICIVCVYNMSGSVQLGAPHASKVITFFVPGLCSHSLHGV